MLPAIAGQRPRLRPPTSALAAAQDARECGPLVLAPNQLHEGHVRIRREVINQVTLCGLVSSGISVALRLLPWQ